MNIREELWPLLGFPMPGIAEVARAYQRLALKQAGQW